MARDYRGGPNRKCGIPECSRRVGHKGARGLCSRHYQRWLATGSPVGTRRVSDESRFFAKVRQAGECWKWIASTDGSGYGMFSASAGMGRKRTERAHRWSYQFLRADIPTGLELDHLCRNRWCVNAWHLEPVTQRVNYERGQSPRRMNQLKAECLNGHPFSPENTYHHPSGSRVCRTCMAHRRQAYQERRAMNRRAA
jgi:hypothetical protein